MKDITRLQDERWLGNEQEEKDCYITELCYIHSKLMIVDDRRVIVRETRHQLGLETNYMVDRLSEL